MARSRREGVIIKYEFAYCAVRGGTLLQVNWLLNDQPLPVEEELALAVLDHLLLGTSSAPLHKALIESSVGESVAGGGKTFVEKIFISRQIMPFF